MAQRGTFVPRTFTLAADRVTDVNAARITSGRPRHGAASADTENWQTRSLAPGPDIGLSENAMRPRIATRATVALTLALLFGGCATSGSESPTLSAAGAPPSTMRDIPGSSGSPSPLASDRPSIPPVPSTAPLAAVLPVDSIAEVVTDGLLVRTKPGVASDSKKLAPLLRRRSRAYVVAGPTRASSYDWYLVRPLGGSFPSGWVAASDHDGTPWLASADIACPGSPGLRDLGRMDRYLALACYRAREFRFEGMLTSTVASCDGSLSTAPSWLDDCYAAPYLAPDKGAGNPGFDGSPVIEVRIPPDVERRAAIAYPPYGMLLPVRVTGHFDDPRAASCRTNGGEGAAAPPPAIYVLVCRAEFVATTVEVLTGPVPTPS